MKKHLTAFAEFMLKKLRWLVAAIGLLLFVVLWSYVSKRDPSTVSNSLIINLAATALTISFTAILIDWLQDRRQQLLVAKPLRIARHELSSICFILAMSIGKPYLGSGFPAVLKEALKDGLDDMQGLAGIRRGLIDALGRLGPVDFPPTNKELAASVESTLTEQINSIDEVLRLYGFSLDADLRDSVHLLRGRVVSLRDVLNSFKVSDALLSEPEMQKLVGLQLHSLIKTIQTLGVEWSEPSD